MHIDARQSLEINSFIKTLKWVWRRSPFLCIMRTCSFSRHQYMPQYIHSGEVLRYLLHFIPIGRNMKTKQNFTSFYLLYYLIVAFNSYFNNTSPMLSFLSDIVFNFLFFWMCYHVGHINSNGLNNRVALKLSDRSYCFKCWGSFVYRSLLIFQYKDFTVEEF